MTDLEKIQDAVLIVLTDNRDPLLAYTCARAVRGFMLDPGRSCPDWWRRHENPQVTLDSFTRATMWLEENGRIISEKRGDCLYFSIPKEPITDG